MNNAFLRQACRILCVLPAFLLIAALLGCEKHHSGTSSEITNSSGSEGTQAKQALVRGNYHEPFSLDPHFAQGMDPHIIRDLQEGLVAEAPGGGIRPAVASHWEMLDSKTYLFHLRPAAKWSNGDPITAQDFVYSWQRLVDPATASPHASYLADIKVLNAGEINRGELPAKQLGIRAIDDHTLKISLETSVPYFLSTLVDSATFPVHQDTILKYGHRWTSVGKHVGNGAFSLDIWQPNERIELVRNPQYWDALNVRLNRVIFLPITAENAELNRYLAGEIDITSGIPSSLISSLRQERPEELILHPTFQTRFLELNTRTPPFDNIKVRRALALAIDRNVIVEKLWKRGDLPAYSLVPPTKGQSSIFTPEWALWSQDQREDEARNLFSEVGYSAKAPLRFTYTHMASNNSKKMALALAAMWENALPAEVEIKSIDGKALIDNVMNGDFTLLSSGTNALYNEPSGMLNGLLSTAGQNFTGFSSPEYDKSMQDSLSLEDPIQRFAQYAVAEGILSEDMPIIPLYHKVEGILVKPHVRGYKPSMIGHIYSRDLWIDPYYRSAAQR